MSLIAVGSIFSSTTPSTNIFIVLSVTVAVIVVATYLHRSDTAVIYESYTDLAYTQWAPLLAYLFLVKKLVGDKYDWRYYAIFLVAHFAWVFYTSLMSNQNFLIGILVV